MDHVEARELIELAAVEPDGLERLMAADTPEGAAVAGHLAGCVACVADLAKIRRTSAVVRGVIVASPDPVLRERTLAYVREVGRSRSTPGAAAAVSIAASSAEPVRAGPGGGATVTAATAWGRPAAAIPRWMRYGLLAAALVIAAGLGFAAASLRVPEPTVSAEIQVLQATTEATLRLEARPDTERVQLVATPAGAGAAGTLLFSPSSGELVMVAEGLSPLAEGAEYGCWVEVDGARTRIGRMYSGGELQSWAGPVDGLADLPPGARFGVSLVPADGGAGEPVLTGGS